MQDIAKIGFQAETTQLADAKKKLEQLEPAAKKVETATDKLAKKMGWAKDAQGKWRDEMGKFVPAAQRAASGIDGLESRVGKLGISLGSFGRVFASFSGGLLGALGIGAATLGIGAMVPLLADFESEMSSVAAVSGATGDVLERLRDTAKDLGATTEFSATQAASGLKLLSQAGYDAESAIATIPAVLNLATTEAMDLGVATDYVASIMAGFGLAAQDAGRATDVLVYASNAANTGVADLGEGMKYVAPIARALNISLEDTAAALGILSNAGLKGSQAGTALRGSLAALGNPSKTAADEIARLGLSISELNPQANSITDIIDSLAGAGMTAASAFKIFGTESAPAILALVANKDQLRELSGEMSDVAGTAQRVADIMRDNLRGSLQNLSSAIESVVISLGEAGLTAIIRGVIDGLTNLALGISTAVNYFSAFLEVVNSFLPSFEMFAISGNTVIGVISGMAVALSAYFLPAAIASASQMVGWVATLYLVNGGFVGLAASVYTSVAALVTLRGALIATGIGAIAVAIGLAVNAVLNLRDELGSLSNVWTYVVRVGQALWEKIAAGGRWVVGVLKRQWILMQVDFANAVARMQGLWVSFLQTVSSGLAGIPGMEDFQAGIAGAAIELEAKMSSAEVATNRLKDSAIAAGNEAAEAFKKMTQPIDLQAIKDSSGQTFGTGLTTGAGMLPGTPNTGGGVTLPPPEIPGGGSAGGGGGAAAEQVTALEKLAEAFGKLMEPAKQAETAFKALEDAKDMGVLSSEQYVQGLAAIEEAFLAAGGTAAQWANVTKGSVDSVRDSLEKLGENSIKSLGDNIADLAVDGSANFGDLAKSIVKDLIKIAYQALIVKPLMGFLGFADGATFGVGAAPAAQPFAKGGAFTNSIVTAPTPFKFAAGGGFALGEMGEAGPEAVMPLTRGPDGSLGVQMYGSNSTSNGGERELRIVLAAEEGEMFRPVIREISSEQAVVVVEQAAPEMIRKSVSAAKKSKQKSNAGWM
ncbi:phage tail tape measure protein [candidate division KSB1 bacterium]|nr:phage tail tape measure protein [candidate division KSB1 bacterium]